MSQRILIIDDERDVRQCVQDLLSLIPDCDIVAAATFTEGTRRARESWDLVISDFNLPDGNGVDLLQACARASPGTPRMLMTAYDDHPQVLAALDGSDLAECIAKPFDPDLVLGRVQRLLGREQP